MKISSIGYSVLREIIRIPYRLFYRKIKIIGAENIPTDKPIIFAPNHQNALMDPAAMIFSTSKQIVFLARGDAFKGKRVTAFFNFLKILPVYRQHDGKDALKKNDAVFAESVDYLEQLGGFCLFPEAIHNPHRNLRPLKKAIPRIAFQALKETDYQLDIKIIPTGIYYEDKDDSHSYLQIKYGKAISVKAYIEQVKENEQKAMLQLSKDMSPLIKPLIIDIEENENYSLVEDIRALYSNQLLKRFKLKENDENRFLMDQALIEEVSRNVIPQSLNAEIDLLKNTIEKKNWTIKTILSNLSFMRILGSVLLFLILMPLAIQGIIINAIPFRLSKYLRTSFIKDPQFTSSIKFIVGAFIMPLYFIILSLISLIFIEYYWSLLVFVLLPFTSYISYLYFKKLGSFVKLISYKYSKSKKNIDKQKAVIFNELDKMFTSFEGLKN